ncbi:MAG: hypothetical protein Q9159_003209 [Coniocarpon cinnabarinum]
MSSPASSSSSSDGGVALPGLMSTATLHCAFVPDNSAPILAEIARKAGHFGWDDQQKNDELDIFLRGTIEAFTANGLQNHAAWVHFSRNLGLPVANNASVRYCKKLVRASHYNIIDVLDSFRAGNTPQTFETRKALFQYTREYGCFVGRDLVKQNKFFRLLLGKMRKPAARPKKAQAHNAN